MSSNSSTKSESFDSDFDEIEFGNKNEENVPPDEIKHVSLESLERQSSRNKLKLLVRKWKRIVCPPRGRAAKYITWILLLAAFFAAMWSVFPEEMIPEYNLFGLVITVLFCLIAETLIVKIPVPKGFPPIPPLLASLLMGLMLRNLPSPFNVSSYISSRTSTVLRKAALTVILTRAGLEIDPEAMRKLKWAVIRLAFSPCIAETCCIGVFGYLILKFPFTWSFMLGFLIAAVSPAVVVPSLILLQNAGWGVEKGIPTLVMAASGIDDVLAITGFTILLGIAIPTGFANDFVLMVRALFSSDQTSLGTPNLNLTPVSPTLITVSSSNESDFNITTPPLLGPEEESEIGKELGAAAIEVVLGIVSGVFFGFLISYLPSQKAKYKSFYRGFLLLSIGIFMVFAADMWEIGGAGTLCALIMSFVASLMWKKEKEALAEAWTYMWVLFQPILFGLTGALVEVQMMNATTVGLGLATLGIGLVGRLMTSTAVTFGLKYNIKEKLFVSVAWIPKGTVQAALGSVALERAIQYGRPANEVTWGEQILVLAVLITLITAPLGSFGISLAGPRLLSKSETPNDPESEVMESHSIAESETHESHSIPSLDSGIILKTAGLKQINKTNENVNVCFEDETATAL